MTYLTAPPALDRPRPNLTTRPNVQLSECGRPPQLLLLPLTRTRAACRLTLTSSSNRLSLELDVVIFHPPDRPLYELYR